MDRRPSGRMPRFPSAAMTSRSSPIPVNSGQPFWSGGTLCRAASVPRRLGSGAGAGPEGGVSVPPDDADTASAVGRRETPVLATRQVLTLAERATVVAVDGALEGGATTVVSESSRTTSQPGRG